MCLARVLSAQVSLPSVAGSPGASLSAPVAFASQGQAVSGVQFDLEYDNSAMSLVAIAGSATRTSGKTLYSADLTPGKRRFLIVGLNQNLITDGALIDLLVNLSGGAASGSYVLKVSGAVAVDPTGLPGIMTGVDGEVTAQAPTGQTQRLQASGVLNAASLLAGPVVPGELIALIGSGIGPAVEQWPAGSAASASNLGGTSVLFDGIQAPLLYAGANQINAVVPYEIPGNGTTNLQISFQGQTIAQVALGVTASAPAIFTLDASGVGAGAILNQDYSVNSPSNPAAKGSFVMVFATGAGNTDPAGVDGQLAGDPLGIPLLHVSAQIGGVDAEVSYAGAAPGLIAGVLQVNCRVPDNVPSGPTVPVAITVGAASSPAGVVMAIQ